MATIYYTAASLDGFLADSEHSLDWLMQFPEDESASDIVAFIDRIGALCMGSHTFEWMWRHHIAPDAPHPMAWPYTQPTWVFSSRTQPAVPGAQVTHVRGDVRAVHADMMAAAAGRDVWVVGGGELAGQFIDAADRQGRDRQGLHGAPPLRSQPLTAAAPATQPPGMTGCPA